MLFVTTERGGGGKEKAWKRKQLIIIKERRETKHPGCLLDLKKDITRYGPREGKKEERGLCREKGSVPSNLSKDGRLLRKKPLFRLNIGGSRRNLRREGDSTTRRVALYPAWQVRSAPFRKGEGSPEEGRKGGTLHQFSWECRTRPGRFSTEKNLLRPSGRVQWEPRRS